VASNILEEEEVPKLHKDRELEHSSSLEQSHARTQVQLKTQLAKAQPAI
jgi:hypothetical protein